MQLFEEVRKKLKMPSYCPLCGKTLIVEEAAIDHIIPIRLGGTNDLDNLRYVCKMCNIKKSDKYSSLLEYYIRLMGESKALDKEDALKIDYIIRNMSENDKNILIEKVNKQDAFFDRVMAYYKKSSQNIEDDIVTTESNQELRENMKKTLAVMGNYDFENEELIHINGNIFKYKTDFSIEKYIEMLSLYGDETQGETYSVYLDEDGRLVVY